MMSFITLSIAKFSVIMQFHCHCIAYCDSGCRFAEFCYAQCSYAQCIYAVYHYVECHYAKYRYAECNMLVVIMLSVDIVNALC